jgi:hypothetical protein
MRRGNSLPGVLHPQQLVDSHDAVGRLKEGTAWLMQVEPEARPGEKHFQRLTPDSQHD